MEQSSKRRGSTAVTYPERMTHYDNEEGMALLRRIAQRRGLKAAMVLRQLVREEARRIGLTDAEA